MNARALVAALFLLAAVPVEHPAARLPAVSVDGVGMTVADMDRAVTFYTSVLSFEKVSDQEIQGREYELLTGVFGARSRIVRLRLGTETIELTEFLAPRGRAMPADMRANDLAFQHVAVVVSDMDAAYERLRRFSVPHASTGPQRLPDWNPNAGGIQAFYFRDPDGHFLEILQFPLGKGERWRGNTGLFLGIDHTAIVVSDTEQSLALYRDRLGLEVMGASENYDTEQEHLNNVFGARLRITTLRASPNGLGIELLEYLAPRDGRPAPADLRANDIAHWQTTISLAGAGELVARAVSRSPFTLVSPRLADVSSAGIGFERGALIRDPDGHGLRIATKPQTASGIQPVTRDER